MLIQADSRREGKVRVSVEVELDVPALSHMEMPAVILLVPVAIKIQPGLRVLRIQNGDEFIGLGSLEVRIGEVIPATLRRIEDRHVPLMRAVRIRSR